MILPLHGWFRIEIRSHRDWLNTICDWPSEEVKLKAVCSQRKSWAEVVRAGYVHQSSKRKLWSCRGFRVNSLQWRSVADMLYTSNFAFFALNWKADRLPKILDILKRRQACWIYGYRIQSTSSGQLIWMDAGSGFRLRKLGYTTVPMRDHGWSLGHSHWVRQELITTTLGSETKKKTKLLGYYQRFWYLATILISFGQRCFPGI